MTGPIRSLKNASSAAAEIPDAQPRSVATYPASVIRDESAHGETTGAAEAATGLGTGRLTPAEPWSGGAVPCDDADTTGADAVPGHDAGSAGATVVSVTTGTTAVRFDVGRASSVDGLMDGLMDGSIVVGVSGGLGTALPIDVAVSTSCGPV